MTYVEFFSTSVAENICACLARKPDRVILVGDKRKQLQNHAQRYQQLFAQRGDEIEFLWRSVNKNDMQSIIDALSELVETYDDCVFDLTGGEDLYLVAMGIVSERYSARELQLQRFNLHNGTVIDCDLDGAVLQEMEMPQLSVEENVRFYGGEILYGGDNTYRWDMNQEFMEDIAVMWDICCTGVQRWNALVSIFALADELDVSKDSPLRLVVQLEALRRELWYVNEKYFDESGMTQMLQMTGMLTRLDIDGDTLIMEFKNQQIKRVLTKAGNILELAVYLAALLAQDDDGPTYNDIMTGVSISWDGEQPDEVVDIRNEIDVLLMRGMVPVFISCKNGDVKIDELYKLSAVANQFGGNYGKKVLVATALESLGIREEYIRARAEDMDIRILDDVQDKKFSELVKTVRTLWKTSLTKK